MTEEITVTIKMGTDGSFKDNAPWIVHRAPSVAAMLTQLDLTYGLAIGDMDDPTLHEVAINAAVKAQAEWAVIAELRAEDLKKVKGRRRSAAANAPAEATQPKRDRAAELTEAVEALNDQASIRAWLAEHRAELRKYPNVVILARTRFDSFATNDNNDDIKEDAE